MTTAAHGAGTSDKLKGFILYPVFWFSTLGVVKQLGLDRELVANKKYGNANLRSEELVRLRDINGLPPVAEANRY